MAVNLHKIGKENGFSDLPEDRYTVAIEKAEYASTKAGAPMTKVTFIVTEGPYKNRKIFMNYTYGEKSVIFVFTLLRMVGSTLANSDQDLSERAISDEIGSKTNIPFSVFVSPQKSEQGSTNYRFSSYKPIEGNKSVTTEAPATETPSDLFK